MQDDQQDFEKFVYGYRLHQYGAKSSIIDAMDQPQGIYWLESGKVRQFIISEDGEELTLHVFEPGSYFPLMWALNAIPNRYYYESIDEVQIRIIPIQDFLEFVRLRPELLLSLTQRLLFGLNGLLMRIELLSLQSARIRVISALLYLSRHFGEAIGNKVVMHTRFTHKDIATYTGLARETTSVELSKLEKQNLVGYDGNAIIINDLTLLEDQLHT